MENNILIAEFIGAKKTDVDGLQKPIWYPINGESVYEHKLAFHKDWNLLMMVLGKIEGLGYWVNRIIGDVWVVNDEGKVIINNPTHEGGIDATYQIVVEFIKWYNQQNN